MNLLIDALAEIWLAIVILHNVQALIDGLLILQREYQPATQQTASHRAHCLVDDIQQRLAIILHRMNQFQTADRKLVQSHVPILFDAGYRSDMSYLGMLCLFEILQDGS